jgi:hypothetical protein
MPDFRVSGSAKKSPYADLNAGLAVMAPSAKTLFPGS